MLAQAQESLTDNVKRNNRLDSFSSLFLLSSLSPSCSVSVFLSRLGVWGFLYLLLWFLHVWFSLLKTAFLSTADKACVWKIRLFPSLVFTSFFPSAVSLPWPVLSSSQGSVPGFSFPSIFFFLLPLLSAAQFVSYLYENVCSYFFFIILFFCFFPSACIPSTFYSSFVYISFIFQVK